MPRKRRHPCARRSAGLAPAGSAGHIRHMTESQWLSLVASLMVLAILYPGLRRMPREGMLRNIVIWLAAFAVLGLIYNAFGPF